MSIVSKFLRDRHGALAIEIALFVPVFILIFWFTAEVCRSYRLENTVHRSTAAIADMIANQRLEEGVQFRDALPDMVEPALLLLREMVTPGDPDAEVGIAVTYFDTTSAGVGAEDKSTDEEEPIMFTFRAGAMLPEQGLPDLFTQSEMGLVTYDNAAKMELVRVEVCLKTKQSPYSVKSYVFPDQYVSNFTAMRKEW